MTIGINKRAATERILAWHCPQTPEGRLGAAILAQAINDLSRKVPKYDKQTARRFIYGGGMQGWCDLLGLETDYVLWLADSMAAA